MLRKGALAKSNESTTKEPPPNERDAEESWLTISERGVVPQTEHRFDQLPPVRSVPNF